MSYDKKCWDLADDFLADSDKSYTPAAVEALAQLIQTTIEDFIEFDVAMKTAS